MIFIGLRFNKPIDLDNSRDMSFIGKLAADEEENSLVALDTLKIDSHFRITLSKEVRNILPLMQGDTIAFYQDGEKGDILLKLQRDSKILGTFRITREKTYVNGNISATIAGQHPSLGGKTRSNSIQEESTGTLAKITEFAGSRYYVDDPLKRYFPSIILIDDDSDILLTFQTALSVEGFNVHTFSKSDEAIEYLTSRQGGHRVVITDIRMPGLNGIELYRILKSANLEIKVIFISALDAAEELLSIFPEIKSQDIISKPIENNEFVNKVKAAIFN